MSVGTLDELAEKAEELASAFTERRTFDEARALLQEAGMNRARQSLADALARIAEAQSKLRAAQELAAIRKRQVDEAIAEAEWALDSKFVREGTKTFLVIDGKERKAMTADERVKWKQTEARKQPAVADAAAYAAGADSEVGACRDALDHARLAFSAAKHDLEAACVVAQTLAASLPRNPERNPS